MPGNKPTKATQALRIQQVVGLVTSGLTRAEICRYLSEKTNWNVTDRTVERYMSQARQIIEEAVSVEVSYELGLGLMRLEDLYKRSVSGRDYKAALAVQKERHELLGLKKQETGRLGEITINVVHREDDRDTEDAE